MLEVLCGAALLVACEGPTQPSLPLRGESDGVAPQDRVTAASLPAIRVLRELPPGTVLRLVPTRVEGEGATAATTIDGSAVDALLREALRQSARFDVAADLEDGPATAALLPIVDQPSQQLALALLDPSGVEPPLPIAAANVTPKTLADTIDGLALTARRALGDLDETPPLRCASAFSPAPDCVRTTERALTQLGQGRAVGVESMVAAARRADPGAPLAWLSASSLALLIGDAAESQRLAEQALRLLGSRLAPTTQHRLARAVLLARAQQSPATAREIDHQLLELGEVFMRERPFDPHGRYTKALALNHLGEFERALVELDVLAVRWPNVPHVAYHRAFALLGVGRPKAALTALDQGARALPEEQVLLPRALALYGSGEPHELDEQLARMARRDPDGTAWRHDLLRMRASLAILDRRNDDAIRFLLEDLQWLHARPTILSTRVGDVAEAGECLVRLDASKALAPRLDAFLALPGRIRPLSTILTYLGGLVCIAVNDPDGATLAAATLDRSQEDLWAARLRAARAHGLGRIDEEARELATAIRLGDAYLDRADFARALDALGRTDDARVMREDSRQRLFTVRLRGAMEHPLLSPARALAFVPLQ